MKITLRLMGLVHDIFFEFWNKSRVSAAEARMPVFIYEMCRLQAFDIFLFPQLIDIVFLREIFCFI